MPAVRSRAGRPRAVLVIAAAIGLAAAALGQSTVVCAREAGGATALDHFLDGLHSLSAEFSQEVTGPHGRIVSRSTGRLVVLRPGKFRWVIRPQDGHGGGQLIVADGRNLWTYDRDLQQVTVRRESRALTATPALLLSGGAHALAPFTVSSAGQRHGLDWVRIVPKAADADFKQARLGFAGRELKRMILDDKLGQTVTLTFEHAKRNVPIAASEVRFTPPPGADVIGKPVQ